MKLNGSQITVALCHFVANLTEMGVPAIEHDPTVRCQSLDAALAHLRWMAAKAQEFAVADPDEAIRWICFIQGVLWANDLLTIDVAHQQIRG